MIGKTILHYEIFSKLGEGGMGVVYKARDTKLDREVAIKFLPRHIAGNADERDRFKIEAKAAAALNHANIATIHSIEEADDETFIVMEYAKGRELKARIDERPLSIDEILDITTQIAKGPQAAHEEKVVHRDIKSANIMITDKGEVKIMDFGLAKREGQIKLTKEGTTLGTVAYMSPEQTQGSPVDQRSDIFSMGVLIYEMLTGQLPFKGDYDQAVAYAILHVEPEPVTGLRSGIPLELERIVSKCLRKDAAARYQQANELIADLHQLIRPETQTRTHGWLPVRGGRKSNVAAVFVAFVAIAVLLGYWVSHRESRGSDAAGAAPHPQSIAILPFENLGSDPDTEPFVRGMHHDLYTQLSGITSLRVTPLTSVRRFAATEKSAAQIGHELQVASILEGSIQRVDDRVRVNVSLINGRSFWASSMRPWAISTRRLTCGSTRPNGRSCCRRIFATARSSAPFGPMPAIRKY